MLLAIPVVLVGAVAALLGYAATRPNAFRYERRALIAAPPERIFPHINNLAAWAAWSPWERMDPGMKRTYEGPDEGPGAAYAWEGDRKVGAGRMEILDVDPPNRVTISLDFLKPFEAHNTTEFTLTPTEQGTEVVWAMSGENALMSKVMGIFMNMEEMIGKDFDAGLANLRGVAE